MTAVPHGNTVLVTGAGQGIGATIAKRFVAAGFAVLALDRSQDALAALVADLGDRVTPLLCNLGDTAQIDEVWAQSVQFANIDVLVNNAAMTHVKPLWDVSLTEWDEIVAVNQRAVFWLSRLAGRQMKRRGSGRIVNIASLSGQAARPSGAPYAATKAAVIALTRVFAAELAGAGVTVNAVAPGTIETPMTDALPSEVRQRLVDQVPVGRLGSSEDIAAAVLYLASEGAGFITGATIDVNGGVLMR